MEGTGVLPTSTVRGRRQLMSGALFAGAGGLATGFYQAGFTPVFFIAINARILPADENIPFLMQ
jgi:hypothetical protein